MEHTSSICTAPTSGQIITDRLFRVLTFVCAWMVVLIVLSMVFSITWKAVPAIQDYGTSFLTTTTWDVGEEGVRPAKFGALPGIWGTMYSSLLALAIGGFFGVSIAIFLTQDFLPPKLEIVFKNIVELLAAIPSVVYGLWGYYAIIPLLKPIAIWLNSHMGWFPFFSSRLNGPGMLPSALVLAIMILPTVTAISRDALSAVPHRLKEAAFGLGATRWEAILGVILPTASKGVFGALVLAFGRALGETMALAMLLGGSSTISLSLFAPSNTLAAMLALKFNERQKEEEPALWLVALILMAITLIVNSCGLAILNQTSKETKGKRK